MKERLSASILTRLGRLLTRRPGSNALVLYNLSFGMFFSKFQLTLVVLKCSRNAWQSFISEPENGNQNEDRFGFSSF